MTLKPLFVLMLVLGETVAWWWGGGGGGCSGGCLQNCYDGALNVQCNSRSAFYRVRSYHKNCREDRIWQWYCRTIAKNSFSYCIWYWYQNDWDQPLMFRCPANYVMTGVYSYHDNGKEDRRWRFKCCYASKHYPQEIAEFLVMLTPGMETWTTVHTVVMPLWEHLATMTMEKSESVHC